MTCKAVQNRIPTSEPENTLSFLQRWPWVVKVGNVSTPMHLLHYHAFPVFE